MDLKHIRYIVCMIEDPKILPWCSTEYKYPSMEETLVKKEVSIFRDPQILSCCSTEYKYHSMDVTHSRMFVYIQRYTDFDML